MIFFYDDYRAYLKQVALNRKRDNPRYSFRALAGNLGLGPSMLTEVLKGRRNLSNQTAHRVATKLGLKDAEADYFCLLVEIGKAKALSHKSSLLKQASQMNPRRSPSNLDVEHFHLIADWYHLALLTCLTLPTMRRKATELARMIGISASEAELALDRLVRLKLAERTQDGRYVRKTGDVFVTSPRSSEALNSYHRQMLSKAADSIEGQQRNERIIRTENFAIDSSRFEEADRLVEEFFAKMSALADRSPRKNTVYHLGTQFFRLAQAGETK